MESWVIVTEMAQRVAVLLCTILSMSTLGPFYQLKNTLKGYISAQSYRLTTQTTIKEGSTLVSLSTAASEWGTVVPLSEEQLRKL